MRRSPRALIAVVLLAGCREVPVGHRLADGPLLERPALPGCLPGPDLFCGAESTEILRDARQGFTSFHQPASGLPKDHPRAPVAYTRFWWDELEPEAGKLRFELIDAELERAAAEGQRFAFRVMAEEDGKRRVPSWLEGGAWGSRQGGPTSFSPAYDAAQFLEAVERTVKALGARYGGDARVDHVDVGFVGNAGEWAYANAGTPMPSTASRERIFRAFDDAFPRTPVLMLIGATGDEGAPLREALAHGFGWRADCWGDLRGGWNHHDDFYDLQLARAGALEAWRQAPVAVETCGDMSGWAVLGYEPAQVRWVLKWALEHHVSFINNKSRAVPSAYRSAVDEYLALSGTRPYVHQARRTSSRIEVTLFNRGTTPPYARWRLALRVRGERITESWDVKLEGEREEVSLDLPTLSGTLDVAVLDERNEAVPLANQGVRADDWLELFPR